MINYQSWFTLKKTGTIAINGQEIYQSLYPQINQKLKNNILINQIVEWIKEETIKIAKTIYDKNLTTGSLNNCLGAWNEYIATTLLSEIIIESNQNKQEKLVIFSLPKTQIREQESNVVSSKFINLFDEEALKLNSFKEKIFFSSPDFIIVNINNLEWWKNLKELLKIQAEQPYKFDIYEYLKSKLQPENVKAIISLKTSYRGDRRYQPLFEAAMIKSMAYLLQVNWKYYVVASEVTPSDRKLFNTIISPHGIALGKYLKLVDATFNYHKKQDLFPLIQDFLE